MKKQLNRKGFTLIELLAVIVILAIIILIAMPNVLTSMEDARRGSFATEVNSIVSTAGSAYAELAMTGKVAGTMCIDVQKLGNQSGGKGYMKKDLSGYTGHIYLKVTDDTVEYDVSIASSSYIVTAAKSEFSASDVSPSESKKADNCSEANKGTSVFSS